MILAGLGWLGALPDYYQQVWNWGFVYARSTFIETPVLNGLHRTANWLGFHAVLVVGAFYYGGKGKAQEKWRLLAWLVLSAVAVMAGWRFFPRYYFQLLPPLVLLAARGLTLLGKKKLFLYLLLLVPFLRFGPPYVRLAYELWAGNEHAHRDVVMDQDSRRAAARLNLLAQPGDTLFVWGYRPDIFVYTRLPAGTRFLESQPLTGVFADRHLFNSKASAPRLSRKHREELARTHPTFVVDGLALLNPQLALSRFEDLHGWLQQYQEVDRTKLTIIYKRKSDHDSTPEARFP
jgi:hypothetical protein